MSGWIGVDFDGTLAHYESFKGPGHVGEPVPAMVDRVKAWLAVGWEVRVFTARVSHPQQAEEARAAIEAWCERHIGQRLAVTCTKDYAMVELWDDRCVQVVPNTGQPVGHQSTRGLR